MYNYCARDTKKRVRVVPGCSVGCWRIVAFFVPPAISTQTINVRHFVHVIQFGALVSVVAHLVYVSDDVGLVVVCLSCDFVRRLLQRTIRDEWMWVACGAYLRLFYIYFGLWKSTHIFIFTVITRQTRTENLEWMYCVCVCVCCGVYMRIQDLWVFFCFFFFFCYICCGRCFFLLLLPLFNVRVWFRVSVSVLCECTYDVFIRWHATT